LSHILF